MRPDDRRHGTSAGYYAHRTAGVAACQPCKDAIARYERGRQWDLMCGRERRIAATRATLRLQALAAIGWSAAKLADQAGMKVGTLRHIRAGYRRWVSVGVDQAVDDVYNRLSMTPGPSTTARNRASRSGWLPPLAYDDIDEVVSVKDGRRLQGQRLTCTDAAEAAVPRPEPPLRVGGALHAYDVDEVVVLRILSGDYRLRANVAEKAEVVRRWRGSLNQLEELTGWRVARYTKEAAA